MSKFPLFLLLACLSFPAFSADSDDIDDYCADHPTLPVCREPEMRESERQYDFIPTRTASGTCPADIQLNFVVTQYAISWQPVCNAAIKTRPAMLAINYLLAAIFLFKLSMGGY